MEEGDVGLFVVTVFRRDGDVSLDYPGSHSLDVEYCRTKHAIEIEGSAWTLGGRLLTYTATVGLSQFFIHPPRRGL
jgi:hypothetical protein